MNKKILAREWIYFLISLLIGLTIIPVLFVYLFAPNEKILNFYSALFSEVFLVVWLMALSPYIIFLFIRSILWALKTLNQE